MEKFSKFVEWLWSKKDQELAFRITTLTESNVKDDATLPTPPLSKIESLTLFRHLEDLKLVYPIPDPPGGTAFLINKTRSYEWDKEIKELKKPKWKRSAIWINFTKIIGIVFLGYLGAIIQKHVDRISRPLDNSIEPPSEHKHRNIQQELANPTQ